ncbi:hypothetical protein D3C76_1224170 [compost metagenome]
MEPALEDLPPLLVLPELLPLFVLPELLPPVLSPWDESPAAVNDLGSVIVHVAPASPENLMA